MDILCQSRAGLRVVGYYHANESMTDVDLKPIARRLADRIQQQQKQAITLLVRHTAGLKTCCVSQILCLLAPGMGFENHEACRNADMIECCICRWTTASWVPLRTILLRTFYRQD